MQKQANRRDFLFSSAAGLSAPQLKAQPGEEVRTAFIGVGARGSGLLKTVLEAPNVRITAICDINPKTRDEALTAAKRDNPRSVAE